MDAVAWITLNNGNLALLMLAVLVTPIALLLV
jgi:hypothetical protein